MKQLSLQPDCITLLSVLTVCNYAGLVEIGWEHFEVKTRVYSFSATPKHWTCVVDLHGQAGQ